MISRWRDAQERLRVPAQGPAVVVFDRDGRISVLGQRRGHQTGMV